MSNMFTILTGLGNVEVEEIREEEDRKNPNTSHVTCNRVVLSQVMSSSNQDYDALQLRRVYVFATVCQRAVSLRLEVKMPSSISYLRVILGLVLTNAIA